METAPDLWWQSLCLDSRWIGIRSIEQIDVLKDWTACGKALFASFCFMNKVDLLLMGTLPGW